MIFQENKWIKHNDEIRIDSDFNRLFFNIDMPIKYSMEIHLNNTALEKDLKNIYDCTTINKFNIIKKIFIIDKDESKYKNSNNNIGIVCRDNIYMFCEINIGLVKSIVYGIYSSKLIDYDYFPVHGTFFEINNKKFLFYGGQKVGKSTIINNLSNYFDITFGTDDWLLVKKTNNKLNGFSLEKKISYAEKCQTKNNLKSLTNQKKIYLDRKEVFQNCLDEGNIEQIYYLNRKPISVQKLGRKEFIESIIYSAYHCPFFDIEKVTKFWSKVYDEFKQINEINIKNIDFQTLKNIVNYE